jgi:hypothetical protein
VLLHWRSPEVVLGINELVVSGGLGMIVPPTDSTFLLTLVRHEWVPLPLLRKSGFQKKPSFPGLFQEHLVINYLLSIGFHIPLFISRDNLTF